jgi:A/G-specific adenine glycosylase
MLQQTQTARVALYFPRFISRFPSFRVLAKAPLRAVLREWQGLGYNRRAKALWQLARLVTQEFHGKLPRTTAELLALPGVGPYTAAAIQAFAFQLPAAMIETNIRTVYLSHFFPKRRNVHDREILPLVEQTLWRKNPQLWFYALMDYGAFLKRESSLPHTTRAAHRNSASYRRQSAFAGSRRQLRGKVLRTLLQAGPLSVKKLAQETDTKLRELTPILGILTDEGLLRSTNRGYVEIA